MLRKSIKWVLLFLLVLIIASMTQLGRVAITVVPTGWLHFLRRTLPSVTINWSGVGMVTLCSALIFFGLHWFLSWMRAARAAGSDTRRDWRLRWTFALFGFFWLLFGIVMGASGLMRETSWLIEGGEPIYKPRLNPYVELRYASWEAQNALLAANGDIQQAQKLLISSRRNGASLCDHYQFIFLPNRDNEADIVIVPRDPEVRLKLGFLLLHENSREDLPIDQLQTILRARPADSKGSDLRH